MINYKRYFPKNFIKIFIKGALSVLRQFLAFESPLNMMEKAFYFTLKALFVGKIFKYCLDFLVMRENNLIRKITLISKL